MLSGFFVAKIAEFTFKTRYFALKFKNRILLVWQAVGRLRLEVLLVAFYFAFARFKLKGAKILHDLTQFEIWDNIALTLFHNLLVIF